MQVQPPLTNGHSNGYQGLIGEVASPPNHAFDNEISWNHFSILISKLGIVPDINSKLSVLHRAEESIDKLVQDKARAIGEVNRLNDLNTDLKKEVADLKAQYAQVASHNAKIHENESAAVIDGMEKEKTLNDVIAVLPFQPEEITKKGVWTGFRMFRMPYLKKIKELEHLLKQAEKEHTIVTNHSSRNPWWVLLPGLGGEYI